VFQPIESPASRVASRPAARAPEIIATRPAGPDPVVVRGAGVEVRASEAFESLLFHFREEALETLRKLAVDAVARAEAARLGVHGEEADLASEVARELEELRKRIETEYAGALDVDRFLEEELLTTREDYERSLRRFVEVRRLTALLIRYDQIRSERVVIREIVARDREHAEELRAKLAEGAEFAALARGESTSLSRADGGRLPPFDREHDHPAAELAFAGTVGSIVGPIEDLRGGSPRYVLARILERIPARDVPFDAVSAEIAQGLQARPIERFEYEAFFRKASRRYPVEMLGRRR
jgi:parvulin-like peptidyl-prolyl isomerase